MHWACQIIAIWLRMHAINLGCHASRGAQEASLHGSQQGNAVLHHMLDVSWVNAKAIRAETKIASNNV